MRRRADSSTGSAFWSRRETRRGQSCCVQPRESDARRAIDGRQRVRRRVALPVPLPIGYHRLLARSPALESQMRETTLIIVPRTLLCPRGARRRGERGWGLDRSALHAAHRPRLGHRRLRRPATGWSSGRRSVGADFVGLNPIHALFPARPEHCSPVRPFEPHRSSTVLLHRRCGGPGVQTRPLAAQRLGREIATSRERLARLRAADLVDYARRRRRSSCPACACCTPTSRAAAPVTGESDRGRAFREFVAPRPDEPLRDSRACFDSPERAFSAAAAGAAWPPAFHDPESPPSADFARAVTPDADRALRAPAVDRRPTRSSPRRRPVDAGERHAGRAVP